MLSPHPMNRKSLSDVFLDWLCKGKADELIPSIMTLNHPRNSHDAKEQPLERENLSLFRADPDLFNNVESTTVHSHANLFVSRVAQRENICL